MSADFMAIRRLAGLLHPDALDRLPTSPTVDDLADFLAYSVPARSVGAPDGAQTMRFKLRGGDSFAIRVPDEQVTPTAFALTSGRSCWVMDAEGSRVRFVDEAEVVEIAVSEGGALGLERTPLDAMGGTSESEHATLADGTVLRERTAGSLGLAGRDLGGDDSARWTPPESE